MKTELLAVLREMASELADIKSALRDPKNGLAAIRLKVDMKIDDHDEALRLHAGRLATLEKRAANGHDAE